MNSDIVLCGVGGQGILSIASVLDRAAMASGLEVRQPEVHGMAQRGGAVQAFVRMADHPIACDLIPQGHADAVLSVEPMEALRYLDLLKPDGWVVTDITPFVNMTDYPDQAQLLETLFRLPRVIAVDATRLAKKAGQLRASNMVMLGAASPLLPFAADNLERFIAEMFQRKGEHVVNDNVKAFRMGRAAGLFCQAMLAAGLPSPVVADAVTRLDFEVTPVAEDLLAPWKAFLSRPGAREQVDRAAAAGPVSTRAVTAWLNA